MARHDVISGCCKRWLGWSPRLSVKLVILLIFAMTLTFGWLGIVNISLHRKHLERDALANAESMSDVINRSATYYMLRNEREGLYHLISDVASEPGVLRIRIINRDGRVSFSSDPAEAGTLVDKRTEVCLGCHSQAQPLVSLARANRSHIYRLASGNRVLGIANPIENAPNCANASCHYHPPNQKILGVLDMSLSLAVPDAEMAQSKRQTILYTGLSILAISSLCGLFVWRVVRVPLSALHAGTERLCSGELGYQLDVDSGDELSELAHSFNAMSCSLQEARREIDGWTRTLESRVEEKTSQLNTVHEQMLHAEKLASIGKLSAIVAHEINNPLTGILTYAKLLKKRISPGDETQKETLGMLDVIESESRRCGEIVKNLMTFARKRPMSRNPTAVNTIVERCVKLVQHRLELANIGLHLALMTELPEIYCDADQVAQVILAMVINAIEAMPSGGILELRTSHAVDAGTICIEVRDSGVGIPPQVAATIFEPFFTTKEAGHGLGLGLAVSHSIIESHGGKIQVESQPGHGTTFQIVLPLSPRSHSTGEIADEKDVIKIV